MLSNIGMSAAPLPSLQCSDSEDINSLDHCNCHLWNDINLVSLVADNIKPDWWEGETKICYCLLNKIFDVGSRCEGSQGEVVRRALLSLDNNLTMHSYMKNLKRKALGFVGKTTSGICNVVVDLYSTKSQEYVGQECEKYGITRSVLSKILEINSDEVVWPESEAKGRHEFVKPELVGGNIPSFLSNKVVIELNEIRVKMGKSWSDLHTWLFALCEQKQDVDYSHRYVRVYVERLYERKRELSRHSGNKGKKELNEFLSEEFSLLTKRNRELPESLDVDPTICYQHALDQQALEIERIVNSTLEESNMQVELITQVMQEQNRLGLRKIEEIAKLRKDLQEMKCKHNEKSTQLQNAMERLGKISPRNFNKKIKRRDEMNTKLKDETKQQKEKILQIEKDMKLELEKQAQSYEDIIDEKNESIIRLNDNLDSAIEAKSKAQKLKWYYKDKVQKCQDQVEMDVYPLKLPS